jgi:transposase
MTPHQSKETIMTTTKVAGAQTKIKGTTNIVSNNFDHFVAIDWSMKTAVLARLPKQSNHAELREGPGSVEWVKEYLMKLRGRIILTIEESTSTQWLYAELIEYVDELLVCDPYRNHLLGSGAKTDRIDATKLAFLLRGGLLKSVYHAVDSLYQLRVLMSAYEDLIKMGVRLKNQRKAIERSYGSSFAKEQETNETLLFILPNIAAQIDDYERRKTLFEEQCALWCSKDKRLQYLIRFNGIKEITAVRILAIVLDAHRFPTSHHFLSYCGLVTLPKESGGRSYGRRKPRYNRSLKAVFKSATLAAIKGNNPFSEYYQKLRADGLDDAKARHRVARFIARSVYGVLKTETPFEPYRWRKSGTENIAS